MLNLAEGSTMTKKRYSETFKERAVHKVLQGATAKAVATDTGASAHSIRFGTAKRGLELPQIDPDFQTNQPGVYIVGELGGMGLIRNAVSQGRQAADHIVQNNRRGTGYLDAIVIGAGPAGISTTLRLMEAELGVLLLERERFGGTITHYPRGKVVMTGALDFPLYGRINQRKMSKEQLTELWADIREKTGLQVSEGELVEQIEATPDGAWSVHATSGTYKTANVLLALGRRGAPRKLDVPGEETPKVFYRVIEPEVFKDKDVMVVGGGNAAVESAFALIDEGQCTSVSISYRKGAFARCRARNKKRIEQEIAAGRLRAYLGSQVRWVQGMSDLTDMTRCAIRLPYLHHLVILFRVARDAKHSHRCGGGGCSL